jgi:hypothetical protein
MTSIDRPQLPPSRWRLTSIAASALGLTLAAAVALGSTVPASALPTAVQPTLTAAVDSLLTLPADDGFNDDSAVQIRSDSALDVSVFLLEKKTNHLLYRLAAGLSLRKQGSAYRGKVVVNAEGLHAGQYVVRIKSDGPETLVSDVPVIVGSGRATGVTLRTSEANLFPLDDGYRDALHGRVIAVDETGTALPFSGVLTLKRGGATRTAKLVSIDGTSPVTDISIVGLPGGNASVRARVTGPAGPARSSAITALRLSSTRVTKVVVASSGRTVYPVADGYADFVAIKLATETSTGTTIPANGTLTVTRKGKLVKKWAVSSSAYSSRYWDGRTNGKIISGSYDLTAAVRGPEGSTIVATSTVLVSAKRLVRKTAVLSRAADRTLREVTVFDAKKRGGCVADSGTLTCAGYGAGRSTTRSLYTWGDPTVPTAIRATVRYRTPTMRVSAIVASVKGSGVWGYGPQASTGKLRTGSHANGWVSLAGNPATTTVSVSLHKNSAVAIDRFRFEYHYYVLR